MLHAGRTKGFAARLNKCLDEVGVTHELRSRTLILSRILQIPRQQAWMMLEGHQVPDEALLNAIAREFEVEATWLVK